MEHWIGHENFEMMNHDIVNPLFLEVDEIYHLASPASPPHYMFNPVKTIKTNTVGTVNVLGLAKRVKARVLVASTSEVYGDPEVHPQPESYWGNVNPIGPRACYDEGKRVAETLAYAYAKQVRLYRTCLGFVHTIGTYQCRCWALYMYGLQNPLSSQSILGSDLDGPASNVCSGMQE